MIWLTFQCGTIKLTGNSQTRSAIYMVSDVPRIISARDEHRQDSNLAEAVSTQIWEQEYRSTLKIDCVVSEGTLVQEIIQKAGDEASHVAQSTREFSQEQFSGINSETTKLFLAGEFGVQISNLRHASENISSKHAFVGLLVVCVVFLVLISFSSINQVFGR